MEKPQAVKRANNRLKTRIQKLEHELEVLGHQHIQLYHKTNSKFEPVDNAEHKLRMALKRKQLQYLKDQLETQ
jgi:uncharacterized protein YoxC